MTHSFRLFSILYIYIYPQRIRVFNPFAPSTFSLTTLFMRISCSLTPIYIFIYIYTEHPKNLLESYTFKFASLGGVSLAKDSKVLLDMPRYDPEQTKRSTMQLLRCVLGHKPVLLPALIED